MRYLMLLLAALISLGTAQPAFAQDADITVEVSAEAPADGAAASATEPGEKPVELVDPEASEGVSLPDELPERDPALEANAQELLSTTGLLVQALKNKEWTIAIGLGMMLLVWLTRRFAWQKMPAEWVPFITVIGSALVTAGGGLAAGEPVGEVLVLLTTGAVTGLTAVGFWEFIGKKLLKPKKE